jgi:hypothetical protein
MTMSRPFPINHSQYGLGLEVELMQVFKHLAVDERTPMNQLVEEAVRDFLRKKGRRPPRRRLSE